MSNASKAPDRIRVLVLGATGMLGHRLWREARERFEVIATVRGDAIPACAEGVLDPAAHDHGRGGSATGRRSSERSPTARPRRRRQLHRDRQAAPRGRRPRRPRRRQLPLPASGRGRLRAPWSPLDPPLDRLRLLRRPRRLRGGRPPRPGRPLRALEARRRARGRGHADAPYLDDRPRARSLLRAARVDPWRERRPSRGFPNALFSGPTTPVLRRLICDLIANHGELSGLFHVAADPISKLDLLAHGATGAFGLGLDLEPDPSVRVDRSPRNPRACAEATGWRRSGLGRDGQGVGRGAKRQC